MKMKYEPVRIIIEDNKRYKDVAFLVDRDDFLEQIAIARNMFGIKLPLRTEDTSAEIWLQHLSKEISNDVKLMEIKKLFNNLYHSKNGEILITRAIERKREQNKKFKYSNLLFYITWRIALNFKLPTNYFEVIKMSIAFNLVSDLVYSNVKGCIFSPFWFLPSVRSGRNIPAEKMAKLPVMDGIMFYFYPQATKKELHQAVDRYYDELVQEYEDWFGSKDKEIDTVSNIKRYRHWYWKKKQGKTYLQIAQEDKNHKNDPADFQETVRKGIKRYEKNLKKPI